MFKNLSPGAIGIRASLTDAIQLAKSYGFGGIDISIGEVAKLSEEKSVDYVKSLFSDAGLKMGGWGLPVNWRGNEEEFQKGLETLPRWAKLGQEAGCIRVNTFVPPTSDERPFDENFEFHRRRFKAIAEILREYDCRFGLEFIGPKTSRINRKYEFIYTMGGMLKLCEAIGTGNVGLLLDAWHWYTSHGTLDELRQLKANQVVYVHVNDAPANIPIDEQIDNIRCLPGETGVIPLVEFLRILNQVGYDGPITPEPFSQKVNQMPPPEAAKVTAQTLDKVWREAGLK
jgi:sugar phosphate isomerase/epimerase